MTRSGNKADAGKGERVRRYRKGWASELVAAAYLLAKGYRIIEWRARGPSGEVDLIARRGRRLAFVEVKYRQTIAAAQAAISPRQQRRLIRAAQHWVSWRPQFQSNEIGMDAIFVCPWHWPRHEINVFYELTGADRC